MYHTLYTFWYVARIYTEVSAMLVGVRFVQLSFSTVPTTYSLQ